MLRKLARCKAAAPRPGKRRATIAPNEQLESFLRAAKDGLSMSQLQLRSPAAKVRGIVYFGRMLDKIRANARGELPPVYQANLGKGFDANCVAFLRVDYRQIVELVKQGSSDEEILEWCYTHGRRPADDDLAVWNEFMRKRGWNDEITEFLVRRKKEAGMAGRSEIRTMFEFIDVDEGRPLPDALGAERKGSDPAAPRP
jgi:hypothetical protein